MWITYKKKIIKETLSNSKTQYRVKEGYVFFNRFEYGWINSNVHWSKMKEFKTIEAGSAVFNTLEEAKRFCIATEPVVCEKQEVVYEKNC